MRNKLKNKKGFTLVEMIVVLAIIAILIALLAPNVAKLIRSSQITSDDAKVKTISSAAQVYGTDKVRLGESFIPNDPINIVDLNATTGNATFMAAWTPTATPGPANAVAFMDGTGDAYLASNSLRGNDGVLLYMSPEGAVIGAVYYGTGRAIKSVTGVYGGPVALAVGVNYTTDDLRTTYAVNAAGTIALIP